ncbi:MAG TPA: sterol desaturase family protein [Vicinamibacterales bacterium]|nr:sterol desaturase family protein [Vicinamibacterales bacterium]
MLRAASAGTEPADDGTPTAERPIPFWARALVVGGVFAFVLWREWRRPLRPETEPKPPHAARNLAVAALGAVTLQLLEAPVATRLSAAVARRRLGLLPALRLPRWLETTAAVLLMDYTLYLWHILVHRVPALWRFHLVHHTDLDLDATTALRFHFGELAISVPWRAAQILAFGTTPRALSIWQTATLASIIFHHSNARLPIGLERLLACLVVTPRMHGIHHSIVPRETDSNFSSGFSWWDRLHGTLRLNVPQGEVVVGVPAYRNSAELSFDRLVVLPFVDDRPTWRLPGDGEPDRPAPPDPPTRLAP